MRIELDELKMSFVEWLYLKDHHVIDILNAVFVANLFDGADSLNIDIVGPPSSTKTELLRSFSTDPRVYTISTLTPQTLISGMKGPRGSLLLNLRSDGKQFLIIKDLTSILEMRSESKHEILGQLREIADGYISKSFGTGRRVEWEGKLGILGGVTPIIDEDNGHNQILGERFLYCRVSNDDPAAMATRARKMAGKEHRMRAQLQEITKQFLDQFKQPKIEDVQIPEEIDQKLIALSCFIAQARTGVSREQYHQTIKSLPEAEGPARLVKQLWLLGAGLATIHEKDTLDESDYRIVKRVAINSMPRHRCQVLRTMWDAEVMGSNWETSRSIGNLVSLPTETAKRYLEDLWLCHLLNRKIEGQEDDDNWKMTKTPYLWQLSPNCIEFIEEGQIFLTETDVEIE